MSNRIKLAALLLGVVCLMLATTICFAQEDDDEYYGGQGGNQGGNQGGQADGDNYQNGNEDGYNNSPNYQQNMDSDSTNGASSYSPQGASDAEGDYDGEENTAASAPQPTIVRMRRSVEGVDHISESSAPKLRVKRHGKYYIGPVYTYVKTDKYANFKWGVKHKVGKKHY